MGLFDDLIPADATAAAPPPGAGLFDDLIPSSSAPETGTAPQHEAAGPGKSVLPERPGIMARVADVFTGNSRTEFPDAPEFGAALMRGGVRPEDLERLGHLDLTSAGRSGITPDPNAQLDILKKNIPGLEARQDAYGNIMLRAPQVGVEEWAYLNRPGVSGRDAEELTVQTLATLPFLRFAGRGGHLVASVARGAAGLGAGEVAKDALATAAGSEQGIDPTRAAVTAVTGAVTAPGVPTAIVSGAGRTLAAPFRNGPVAEIASMVRGQRNPEAEATRRVGTALAAVERAGQTALGDADRLMAEQTAQPAAVIDSGGHTTRALARAASNASPEARGTLDNFIAQRFETQAERAGEFLTSLVGPPANVTAVQGGLNTARRSTLGPLYDAAYQRGAVGLHTPGLAALEAAEPMRRAIQAAEQSMARKELAGTLATSVRGPTTNPTLEMWDQVARSLADDIGRARRSGAMEEARDIAGLRDRLLAELDTALPEYARARGTAHAFFRAGDALEAGETFASQHFAIDAAANAVRAMASIDRDMFRQGFASRMLERLNNTSDRRSVITQVAGSPAARRKLEVALGRNEARQMEAFMRIESMMDLPRGAMGNSTTVRQLMELGLVGAGGTLALASANPSDPTAMGALVVAGMSAALRRGGAVVDRRVLEHVAHILTSQDPAVRQRALQSVARGRGLDTLRQLDRSLTGPVRSGAAQQTGESVSPEPAQPPLNAMAGPQEGQGPRADLPMQSHNAMASAIPRGSNAMSGGNQSGSRDNPIPVRTRADVMRVPSGAYIVRPDGVIAQRH